MRVSEGVGTEFVASLRRAMVLRMWLLSGEVRRRSLRPYKSMRRKYLGLPAWLRRSPSVVGEDWARAAAVQDGVLGWECMRWDGRWAGACQAGRGRVRLPV